MKKLNKTTPTTKKDIEEQVSRKLTPSELENVSGGAGLAGVQIAFAGGFAPR